MKVMPAGQFDSHVGSWQHRKILAKVGPNGDPIATPSICWQQPLSNKINDSLVAKLSNIRNSSYFRPSCSLLWLQYMFMSPFTQFMSWELLIQVHWRHSRALKIIVLGFRNPSFDFKKGSFGSFLAILGQYCSLFLLQNMFMIPFTWFMSWELLLQVHWRHSRALKIITLGSRKPI